MAVFGAPAALEDHAERALHAALAMQERMQESLRRRARAAHRRQHGRGRRRRRRAREARSSRRRRQRRRSPPEGSGAGRGARRRAHRRRCRAERSSSAAPRDGRGEGQAGRRRRRLPSYARSAHDAPARRRRAPPRVRRPRQRARAAPRDVPACVRRTSEPHLVTHRRRAGRREVDARPRALGGARDGGACARQPHRALSRVRRRDHVLAARRDRARALAAARGRVARTRSRRGSQDARSSALALGLDVAPDLHPLDARERLHAAAVAFVEELASALPDGRRSSRTSTGPSPICSTCSSGSSPTCERPSCSFATARPEVVELTADLGAGKRNATVLWLDPLSADGRVAAARRDAPDDCRTICATASSSAPTATRSSSRSSSGELVDSGVLVQSDGRVGARRAPTPASRCRTPCTRCSRRGSTASQRRRRPRSRPAPSSGRVFWSASGRPSPRRRGAGLRASRGAGSRRPSVAVDCRETTESSRSSTRSRARSRTASIPKARRGRLHASFAEWLERASGGSGRARAAPRVPLLARRRIRMTPTSSGPAMPEELGRAARARGALALARRAACARSARDGGGRRAVHARGRALRRRARAGDCSGVRSARRRRCGTTARGCESALLRAVDGPLDDAERADTYAFLAFQSSIRSAMWSIRLNMELIEEWAAEALALAPDGAEAEVARFSLEPTSSLGGGASEETLREASSARRGARQRRAPLVRARSEQRRPRSTVAASTRLRRRASERLALLSRSTIPITCARRTRRHLLRLLRSAASTRRGDWPSCTRSLSQRLSAHHRVHSVSLELELADALGDWHGLAAQTDRALAAIEANLATPCVRNPRDLLLLQRRAPLPRRRVSGVRARARRLTARRRGVRDVPERAEAPDRARTAATGRRWRRWSSFPSSARSSGGRASSRPGWTLSSRSDATTASSAKRPTLVQAETTVEPFALRALGAARRDDELLARADERFVALGLEWHRAQTERLLAGV